MDGFSIPPNKHGTSRDLIFKHEREVSNSSIVPAFMPLQSVGIGTLFNFKKMLASSIYVVNKYGGDNNKGSRSIVLPCLIHIDIQLLFVLFSIHTLGFSLPSFPIIYPFHSTYSNNLVNTKKSTRDPLSSRVRGYPEYWSR